MSRYRVTTALALAGTILTACGGGGGAAPAPKPAATSNGPNGTTQQIGSGVVGTLTLTAANGTGTTATQRKLKFVSPGAVSAGVSINGGTVTYADVSASSSLCTTANSVRTCTINVGAPAGNATFALSLYDAAGGGGHLLSSGGGTATVVAGTAFSVPIAMNAVVASLASNNNTSFTVGVAATSPAFAPVFADPAGQAITGSAAYLHPVTVQLNSTHVTFSPTQLTAPGQSVTVSYDGSMAAPSMVTSTVTSGGATVFTGVIPIPGLVANRCNFTPQTQGGNIPGQITVGPDGNIWFADTAANKIGRITPASGCTSMTFFNNAIGSGFPQGIAAGGDGNIWYSNGGQVIGRMTTSGGVPGSGPATITVGAPGSSVYQLATDSQGNVWYVNSASGFSQIAYVDATTFTVHTFGSTPTANALTQNSAIALGPDNAIWFTEQNVSGHSQVGRMTTPANGGAGTYTESAVSGTTGFSGSASVYLTDLAKGADGNLWFSAFASTATNQTWGYFAPSATTVSSFSEFPNAIDPNAFANLVTMFKGGDNNMWMAEGGGAVKIVPSSPTNALVEIFTDNGQTSMIKCIAGPDGDNWCTVYGSAPLGQGFINTYDGVIYWVPR